MAVTVLLFASLAEAAGTRRVALAHIDGDNVGSVRERLLAEHPGLARFVPNLLYALDEEYVDDDGVPVPDGATLALIPPVSGG
jgi:molybdopterin converting factor small subunit